MLPKAQLAAPPSSTGAQRLSNSALLQAGFSKAVVAKGLVSSTLLAAPPSSTRDVLAERAVGQAIER